MNDAEIDRWDVIIIGSGMGGMAAGAALSRVGRKVLLLEQHQTLGGLTHSFSRDGFTWDVGIHYLSEQAPGERARVLLDWLSDTPIDFVPLGSIYDYVHIGSAKPLSLSRPYEAQEMDLKDRFPDQDKAIEAWTHALREGREAMLKILPTRAMPEIAGDMLDWWNRRAISKWCARTTKEVIDDLTNDPELAAVMAAQWGDHGGRPGKASFAMHAMIAGAYLPSGSWYPVGGSAAFAEHIIPTIAKNGGETREGVRVEGLLFEGGTVVGVRTDGGTELALRLLILTGVRSGPLRNIHVDQIDGDIWTIPAEDMKGRKGATKEFRVPLPAEAQRVIAEARKFARDGFLFPGVKRGVISDMTMTALMDRRGMKERPHGFRTSLRVWLAEATNAPHDVAEMCISHVVGSKTVQAYKRTDFLEQRRALMERWGLTMVGEQILTSVNFKQPA